MDQVKPYTIGNLSDRSRQALEFAVDQAHRMEHKIVTPEHLLLGLIREQRSWPGKLPSYARARKMLTAYFGMEWLVDYDHIEVPAAVAPKMQAERQADRRPLWMRKAAIAIEKLF
jgi:ATP-dependent Clp protease ATP-binding subunit ClpA